MSAIESLPTDSSDSELTSSLPETSPAMYLSSEMLERLRNLGLPIINQLLGIEPSPTETSDISTDAQVIPLHSQNSQKTDFMTPKASPVSTEHSTREKSQPTPYSVVVEARTNQNTFNSLLKKHGGLIYNLPSDYFMPGSDPEDLRQEARIGFYKAVRDFDGVSSSFYAFAKLCVERQVITALKTATRLKHSALNSSVSLHKPRFNDGNETLTLEGIIAAPTLSPEDRLVGEEGFQILLKELQTNMSDLGVDSLVGYFNGMSYREMAEECGVDEKSIDNALQRVKRKVLIKQADLTYHSPLIAGDAS